MVGQRPGEEFYDLRTDPHCINNLASSSSHEQQKQALAEKLLTILRESGDPRVIGEGTTFDLPPFSDRPADQPRRNNRR
jgi:uncharacterized sulfatase